MLKYAIFFETSQETVFRAIFIFGPEPISIAYFWYFPPPSLPLKSKVSIFLRFLTLFKLKFFRNQNLLL